VIAMVGLLWRRLLPAPPPPMHVAVLVCTFAVAMAGGMLGYRLIEAPLLCLLRSRTVRVTYRVPIATPALAALRVVGIRHGPR
jgi:peptidoglycan/LPS O-acetylase OafA/YrhL